MHPGKKRLIRATSTEVMGHRHFGSRPWQDYVKQRTIRHPERQRRKAADNTECALNKWSFHWSGVCRASPPRKCYVARENREWRAFCGKARRRQVLSPSLPTVSSTQVYRATTNLYRGRRRKVVAVRSYCFMWWSPSVTIAQAVHGELLFSEASLSEKTELEERNLQTVLKCRYIDDLFVLGTDRPKVMRT